MLVSIYTFKMYVPILKVHGLNVPKALISLQLAARESQTEIQRPHPTGLNTCPTSCYSPLELYSMT